jgi:hypothetical protein
MGQAEGSFHEAKGSERGMRLNALPFVLAPGVATWGYILSGGTGTMLAIGCWAATVSTATLIVTAREAMRRRRGGHVD